MSVRISAVPAGWAAMLALVGIVVIAAAVAWVERRGTRARVLAGRTVRRLGISLALLAVISTGTLSQLAAAGVGIVPTAQAAAHAGKNTFHPSQDRGGKAIYLPGQVHTVKTLPPAANPFRPSAVTMKPGDLTLNAAAAVHFTSNDKRLDVTAPAGAVTPDLESAAGGPVAVHVEQLEGPSGGTDSADISLGTYRFTLTGPHGPVAGKLAKSLTLTLHLNGWRGAAFDLSHVTLIINGGVPATALAAPSAPSHGAAPAVVKPSYAPATLDLKAATLTAQLPLSSSSGGGTTGTWNTNGPEAQWSKQADTSADLVNGDLTYSYPLDVPAGQGGLAPKLQLSYDSAAVTGNHNPQATSGWLGEGWDLGVGSISWTEHNVTGDCPACGSTWENSWQFSDAYGNSGELIPPNSNASPWYDDTTFALSSEPVYVWHLNETSGHIKIASYTNPAIDTNRFPTQYYPTPPPCFRALLPNGYIEEFGCTTDSLQYYVDEDPLAPNYKTNYVYRWDLDLIIDPNGNQIHFTYNQYMNWDKAANSKFPIDAELATISYDASACHNTTSMCTGSSWNPAAQIDFQTDYAPARQTGTSCATWSNTTTYNTTQTMRCDDVHDLSGSSGTPAPMLQSLQVLNDILVRVTADPSSGTPTWHTLRDYQLSYEQGVSTTTYGGKTITDPNTNMTESVAGYLDLTQIQEVGNDGSTSLPPLSMQYQTVDEYYVDAMNPNAAPMPSNNCGPSWNKGTNGTCKLWAQSYNARYLTELDNGQGWSETYTWKLARNNTHGVNSGLGLEDPFACTNASGSVQASYPCDEADDENWSRVVLTQRQATVQCYAADGLGCYTDGTTRTPNLTSTSSYVYTLTDLVAKQCSDCTVGMDWGDQNDGDKLDFYNGKFMGFHQVNVTNPDGSLQVFTYNSTMGYGVATGSISCKAFNGLCPVAPWTNAHNALHGRLAEEDDYDTDAATLLKQAIYAYNVACPAPGVPASGYNTDASNQYIGQNTSELDPNNPVATCQVTTKQVDIYAVDGGAAKSGSHTTTAYGYSYDSSGHLTQATEDTTANNAGSTPHILKRTQYAWDDAPVFFPHSANGPYLADFAAIETTEDGSGNVKACTYSAYDTDASGATGQQSGLTQGLVREQDRYSANCTPGSLSGKIATGSAYDTSGNVLATADADAMAGYTGHQNATDCTINSTVYTDCAQLDGIYNVLPVRVTNVLGQQTNLSYVTDGANANSPDATNGWGTWLATTTDANGQTTAYQYDALGRLAATAAPGDTLSIPTKSYSYGVTCNPTGAQEPCVSLATTQQLSSSASMRSAT